VLALTEGWNHTEKWGVWALGSQSVVVANLLTAEPRLLVFEARPSPPAPGDPQQAVRVEVNGTDCGTVELDRRWQEYRVEVPPQVLRTGRNTIVLGHRYHHSAKELGRGDGIRQLATGFRKLALVRARPGMDQPLPSPDPVRLELSNGRLLLTRPGSLVIPIRLPRGSKELDIRATGTALAHRPQPLGLVCRLVELDGSSRELAHGTLVSQPEPVWHERIELAEDLLGLCFLVLELRFYEEEWDLHLASPLLRASLPPVQLPPRSAAVPPDARPDIVVIIADAARADHMSCYGYQRQTTPQLEHLARESLVFHDVSAAASYTTCSIPTMITGLAPELHQVIHHHHVLDDSFTTLAEYLADLGYYTVGMSANPYNSERRGSHQGCHELLETWHHFDGYTAEAMDPHVLSRLAIERLTRGFADQPLFMLLHYVPPHAPYTPPPRFDIFGDPDYQGRMNGEHETLVKIRNNELVPGAEDLQRLVSLYDANLLRADDAIGTLLDALRQRERWPSTVVAVTSDHGEAFLEHGYQGHERTVYEEMIRVPLILRLPASLRPQTVSTTRLASLTDLVPTLLGIAGARPRAALSGIDLLAPPVSVLQGEQRVVFSRTDGYRPTYAIRSRQWKAITQEIHARELYNLAQDPGEETDLAGSHPLLLAGLGQLLRQELIGKAETATEAPADADSTASPAELEALRALGYLQ
jgi:arylsulfatase